MFWHFLKVVYSRACESRGVWIKVRKLKFFWYLEKIFCICYNAVRQKESTSIGDAKRKAQGARFPGLFYSVFCMVA